MAQFQDLRTPSGSHTTEVAGFTPHSMSFGLRDLLYGMCDEAIDSAPVTDFSIWSEVFAWADVQSEDALLLPVPEPEDSPFFANPYQLTFTVDSAMLTDVPTLRMSVAAPHLSTEESRRCAFRDTLVSLLLCSVNSFICRVTAEEALVVAALQEDDMENRRLVEERRAEVRRLTEPPAAKPVREVMVCQMRL